MGRDGDAISPAALRELAKARNHTDLAAAASWIETAGTNRPDEVASVVQRAIERIEDDQLRTAARLLFPLPYVDAAESFSRRRAAAAAVYFVSTSTFRSGSRTQPSREDLVLAELGRQLAPTTQPEWTSPDPDLAPGSRRRAARVWGAVAAVALVVSAVTLLDGEGNGNRVAASETASGVEREVPATFVDGDPSGGDPHSTRAPVTDRSLPPVALPGSVAYVPGKSPTPVSIVVTTDDARGTTDAPGPNGRPSTAGDDSLPGTGPVGSTPSTPGSTPPSSSAPAPTSGQVPPQTAPSGSPEPSDSASSDTTGPASPDEAPKGSPGGATADPGVGPPESTVIPPESTASTSTTSTSTSSTTTTSTTTTSTSGPPIDRSCPGSDVTVDRYRLRRVEALLIDLGRPGTVCQATRPASFQNIDYVKFRVDNDDTGWVDLIFDDDTSLVIPQAGWSGYTDLNKAAAKEPNVGDPGLPGRWRPLANGGSELSTTTGIVLSGGSTSIIHFRVAEPFLGAWLADRAALGEPMRSSKPTLVEFEHGRMDLIDGEIRTTYIPFEDARPVLPPDERLANSIIRQPAGTAWWVDDQLRRWWIPHGGVWFCFGAPAAVSADDLEGAVVASLPLAAGRAYCELADR